MANLLKEIWQELEDLIEYIWRNFAKVVSLTVGIWLALPVVAFVLYAIWLIITGITETGIIRLIEMAVDAMLPWYVAVITDPLDVAIQLLLISLLVGGYLKYKKA